MGLEERATKEKPHVKIFTTGAGTAGELSREVELGLEEEGIPGVLSIYPDYPETVGTVELAYAAAEASPLGTGIGIGVEGLAVHYNRLPREKPLFFLAKNECNRAEARRLGANAARLVKGIPFKDKEELPPEPAVRPHKEQEPDLEKLVAAVVKRVLAERSQARGGGAGAASFGIN